MLWGLVLGEGVRVTDGDLCHLPSSKSRAMCLLHSTGYPTCNMSWDVLGCLFYSFLLIKRPGVMMVPLLWFVSTSSC